jgi:hypothetical protein
MHDRVMPFVPKGVISALAFHQIAQKAFLLVIRPKLQRLLPRSEPLRRSNGRRSSFWALQRSQWLRIALCLTPIRRMSHKLEIRPTIGI